MRLTAVCLLLGGLALVGCETSSGNEGAAAGSGAAGASSRGDDGSQVASRTLSGPQPGTQEDLVVNVGDRVFFGFDRYDLTDQARGALEKQAAWLKRYPNVAITVEGHADERGTREYNLALGERRANAVRNYLAALGVPRARTNSISYGKECPVALGSTESEWSQNRRGVSVVDGGGRGSNCAPHISRR